jgi:hypothetical protein
MIRMQRYKGLFVSLAHLPTVKLVVECKFMRHVGTDPLQILDQWW